MIDIYSAIDSLIEYSKANKLIDQRDEVYSRNQVLEMLNINEYKIGEKLTDDFEEIKSILVDYAKKNGIIKQNGTSFEDNFIARIMNVFLKFPSQIEDEFYGAYSDSPKAATDFFYNFSKATDYIKTARLSNNVKWGYKSEYGDIVLTINLAKPEKTPEEILLAKQNKAKKYPKCVLCRETEGLSGVNRAPRQNHRIIGMELDDRLHYFQYSPYSYFNEHCIVLTAEHSDMNLDVNSLKALLAFVDKFEHYFISSNTDLPLVGGSILSHEHYQGGNYVFPLDKAEVIDEFSFGEVRVEKLKWPMASVRMKSKSKKSIISFVEILMSNWRAYNNPELEIISNTGKERHNSLNFVVRKNEGEYSVIVVFRNNRCNEENPKGIFATRDEYRSIKNENIGIIEVLGLAILPGRIRDEIQDMKHYICGGELSERSLKHKEFLDRIKVNYESSNDPIEYIKEKIGEVYVNILSNCSVFNGSDKAIKALDELIINVGNEYEKSNTKK